MDNDLDFELWHDEVMRLALDYRRDPSARHDWRADHAAGLTPADALFSSLSEAPHAAPGQR